MASKIFYFVLALIGVERGFRERRQDGLLVQVTVDLLLRSPEWRRSRRRRRRPRRVFRRPKDFSLERVAEICVWELIRERVRREIGRSPVLIVAHV